MMKYLLLQNYVIILLLLLMLGVGLGDTFGKYREYGFSYDVTTTIAGEETTKTVTLYENLGGGLLIFALLWVVLKNTAHLREEYKKIQQDQPKENELLLY